MQLRKSSLSSTLGAYFSFLCFSPFEQNQTAPPPTNTHTAQLAS